MTYMTLDCDFVTALKLLFTAMSSAFYKHRKRIQSYTLFNSNIKISRKLFQKICFSYVFILNIVIFEKLYFTR